MKLKKPLPLNRSYEQVKNHYVVEKSLADKLMRSTRAERTQLYRTMYDELFSRVPDHPRLTRRASAAQTVRANRSKLSLVKKFLRAPDVFLEFAAGDCQFSFEAARHVKQVYGVDISDQRSSDAINPDNFALLIYDGYNLDSVTSNSVDTVFSDQLVEHFHPDDTRLHFELVHRILKPGGKYVFRTPHLHAGPHDVSGYFSDNPECFHLKEWTYTEMKSMVIGVGYSRFAALGHAKGLTLRLPILYFAGLERLFDPLPTRVRRMVARFFIPSLSAVAYK